MKNRGLPALPKRKVAGFTLIELLVVIAVIGILASVVMASLNSARVKARNARRASDIKQLVNAFNLALDTTGAYPDNGGAWSCVSATCYDGWTGSDISAVTDAALAPYFPTKPSDPVGGSRGYGGYLYNKSWVGGTSAYDGYVFPTGTYLYWNVEPPVSASVCAPGRILGVPGSGLYASCMLQLN